VLVLAHCGLRWGELASLTVADVDTRRSRLEICNTIVKVNGNMQAPTPKDYEEQSVPVPRFVMLELASLLAGRSSTSPVFLDVRSGGPLRNRSFRRYFLDAAADEVGLAGLTPHELRQTCASLGVSAGANVKALQGMLSHSFAKETLDTYADLFDDHLDIVAVALDRVVTHSNVGKVWADAEEAGPPASE
jgi:integrase